MSGMIGGILSGVGSIVGGISQANAANQAAQAAQEGFNYLTSGPGAALTNQETQLGTSANAATGQLLGLTPMGAGTDNAFKNYLDSTGYNFQLGQGINAVNSSASAKGLLNSGGTAKALTQYGQNLASTGFNNYLNQLASLRAGGENALGRVANAGSTAGGNAAQSIIAGGNAMSNAINGGLGGFANAFSNYKG